MKRKSKSYKSPNKITRGVGIDRNIYKKLKLIKKVMKIKSISKVINILLDDEINHYGKMTFEVRHEYLDKITDLISKIGRLDENITGACTNLNQIAYHINKVEYEFNKHDVLEQDTLTLKKQDYQKIINDIRQIQSAKKAVRKLERGANKIWRQLL